MTFGRHFTNSRPQVELLGDQWWLIAHNERGKLRIGGHHFAIGLCAALLGEVLLQRSARVAANGVLVADPAVSHVLTELNGAARDGTFQSLRVWVEWLAEKEANVLIGAVASRMVDAGLLIPAGKHWVPVDAFTAFTPITTLVGAVGNISPAPEPVRLLAGLTMTAGLAPVVSTNGEDMVRPLQLLAQKLRPDLYGLVTAMQDVLHAIATRLR